MIETLLNTIAKAFKLHTDENVGIKMEYGEAYDIVTKIVTYCELNIRNVQLYTQFFTEKFNL